MRKENFQREYTEWKIIQKIQIVEYLRMIFSRLTID